jgi:hypothetical protein
MAKFEKVCLITKETPLEGLKQRYGTIDQARFVLERNQVSFEGYERFDHVYRRVVEQIQSGLPSGTRVSVVDFKYLPTYQFDPAAAIVTVGPDGLVANTAKYLGQQPLIAVNPDPQTIDGVLARNSPTQALNLIRGTSTPLLEQQLAMAEARLVDGQTLLAVNDFFVGQRTHVSARYEIHHDGQSEHQSSSGIIVSTGAGSTGWRKSILTGAQAIAVSSRANVDYAFPPDARQLAFAVREPFVSRASSATIVEGFIHEGESLIVASQMPQNGVIFSDGVESDFMEFNSGSIAEIRLAERTVRLWSVR